MIYRNALVCLTFMLINVFSYSQSPLEAEKYNKQLSMVVANPNYSIHYPTGLIYRDTGGTSFTNLSDYHLRIADKPFGYQIQSEDVIYSQITKNTFSINHFDTPQDGGITIAPSRRAFWGPRSYAQPYSYDLHTFGNISNVNYLDKNLTELRNFNGKGALRIYRYSGNYTYYHTLTINGSGNPAWYAVSDKHSKEKISDHADVLERLVQLQLKEYNYTGTKKRSVGYLAQDVEVVFPELVMRMEDDKLAVNYMGFSPLAVQAIKEQQEKIKALENRIMAIEKMLSSK